ncbi:hypothetical protein ES703_63195 [subsurface metagenome]
MMGWLAQFVIGIWGGLILLIGLLLWLATKKID